MDSTHPLRAYREKHALTQEKLADMLDVSRETVTRWESGARKIEAERLSVVAEKTGIPARELRPDLVGLAEEILREPSEAAGC